jgi:hypothetical protein
LVEQRNCAALAIAAGIDATRNEARCPAHSRNPGEAKAQFFRAKPSFEETMCALRPRETLYPTRLAGVQGLCGVLDKLKPLTP